MAIDLPDEVRDRLGELIARLSGRTTPGTVRWVRPEAIHLTLKFLGEVSTGNLSQVGEVLKRVSSSHGPVDLVLVGLGCFPNVRRPRVIWVGVDEPSGRLVALQQALEAQFERIGYRRETRPFSPHLTLGRVRDGASADAVQEVGRCVSLEPREEIGRVHATAVCLFRSELRPSGAIYTRLAEAPLRGPG